MLYRVAQSPARFPWPTDLQSWQSQTETACRELLENARQELRWRGISGGRGAGLQDRTLHLVELKFHHCMMLLNRPSPAIPHPSSSSLTTCYESATAMIRIQSELARFANLSNSWLTAHSVFVSGITMLYCLWTSYDLRRSVNLKSFFDQADACSKLLSNLGQTWSVAKSAQIKFDHLVQLTKDSWVSKSGNMTPALHHRDLEDVGQSKSIENYEIFDSIPGNFANEANLCYSVPPNMFMDELGDMGTWFDLDWLGDARFCL